MKVVTMYFDAVEAPGVGLEPPFLPMMQKADVAIPAVDSFLTAAARPTIVRPGAEAALHRRSPRPNAGYLGHATDAGAPSPLQPVTIIQNAQYLAAGFQPSDTKQVFADITSKLPPIQIPPARAGGLCAPTLPALDSMSRTLGPTVSAAGSVDPAQIIGQTEAVRHHPSAAAAGRTRRPAAENRFPGKSHAAV